MFDRHPPANRATTSRHKYATRSEHAVRGSQVIDHVGANFVAHCVGIPPGRAEQALHCIGTGVSGLLGQSPAVLSLDRREQSQDERPRSRAGFHAVEPVSDSGYGVGRCCQRRVRCRPWAVGAGRRRLMTSLRRGLAVCERACGGQELIRASTMCACGEMRRQKATRVVPEGRTSFMRTWKVPSGHFNRCSPAL